MFVALLLANWLHAQVIISGKVTDESQQPLAGANVYINGSTIGTITKEDGSFSLNIGRGGFIELVVSHVGHEPLLYRAQLPQGDKRYHFQLAKKVAEMRNVVILSSLTRRKWLEIFKREFLGITQAGKNCTILNESDILFEAGPEGAILASSDVPLVVVNRDLGYKIHFQLLQFSYDQVQSTFVGFSRFEELKSNSHKTKAGVRRRYYEGSTAHFFNALLRNDLEAEGFSINILRTLTVSDSAKTAESTSGTQAQPSAPKGMNLTVMLRTVADSIVQQKLGENGVPQFLLNWNGRLRVHYHKDTFAKMYLQQKVLLPNVREKGIISFVDLLEAPALMDAAGFLANPLAIRFGGFWSYEKLGSMLPSNYLPEKTKPSAVPAPTNG